MARIVKPVLKNVVCKIARKTSKDKKNLIVLKAIEQVCPECSNMTLKELEKVCENKNFPKIASLVRRSYDLH